MFVFPFHMSDTAVVLARWQSRFTLEADRKGRGFVALDDLHKPVARLVVPGHQPALEEDSLSSYLLHLPHCPGRFLVVLVQAGATSLGLWHDDQLLCHKTMKFYVKRGKGKAQTTYLKTRGKSRYGSRLRLQNARMHLEETNLKLTEWWQTHGPVDRVFYACPVRLWSELMDYDDPPPPFDSSLPRYKIARDVKIPGFEELKRVARSLAFGKVELLDSQSSDSLQALLPSPVEMGDPL